MHGLAMVEPMGQYPPSVHGLHSVLPSLSSYLPAAHGSHDTAPGTLLYVPAEQFCGAVAPVEQNAPAGQVSQLDCAALPVALEWLPEEHSAGATAPGGQKPPDVHGSQAVLPSSS